MSGNTIGKLFTVTTFGESHGLSYGCIVDGCPPNLPLTNEDIQIELNKRRPGYSYYTSQRKEEDKIQILSGLFNDKTLGTPIGLLVANTDTRSSDYAQVQNIFRPGHADYTYQKKYGIYDYRGGGRASARETVMRVAAGAIAKKYLAYFFKINIIAYVIQLGSIKIEKILYETIKNNPFFCPDPDKISLLENYLHNLKQQQESSGAIIQIEAQNVPAGLGEPVFDKLDADLAHALMSINAVKGVEVGAGFSSINDKGSKHRDEIVKDGFLTNNAGGILGGISTGQTIITRIILKPTSSVAKPTNTIDHAGNPVTINVTGRHDPCVGIRAVPIAEAMTAIILMDHLLRARGQTSQFTTLSLTE